MTTLSDIIKADHTAKEINTVEYWCKDNNGTDNLKMKPHMYGY